MVLTHKIICGDCIEVMKEMESNSVDLVVTDPPYFVLNQNKQLEKADWDNFENIRYFIEFTKKWLGECYRLLKQDTQVYTFWSQMWIKEFWNLEQPFEIKRMLIWDNPCKTKGFTSKMYLWNYTPIFFLSKGKVRKFNASFLKKENVDVFRFPAPQTNFLNDRQLHFLQKPLKLIEIMIKNSSNEGEIVLDPFLGSGTTMVAAERLGRNSIGIEISKEYCEIAYKRLLNEVRQAKLDRESSVIERVGF